LFPIIEQQNPASFPWYQLFNEIKTRAKPRFGGCISVIPALRRLRQKTHEFKASLGYTDRPYLKRPKQNKKTLHCRRVL
jgi:hypothetical protein